MGVLTVRLTEIEEQLIDEIKKKYNINVNTKALLYAALKCMSLEKEVAELKRDKAALQAQVRDYRQGTLDLFSGLEQLKRLTNN
ncbi:MAG: hypothetical protein AAGC65_07825 [Mucilaginibacter sp.]|uniref:hypothetical protein n=1 Tax=Mucilaginibacter sp. TaxID=1882438 RepID=UPI0031B1778A